MGYGKKNVIKINPLEYNIGLIGESGIGKEQPVSEPVLTKYGWREMGSINIGDKVYSVDGKLYDVTGVFPQGIKDVYELTFSDGTKTRCGIDHLWTVTTKKQRENMRRNGDYRYKVMTLRDILKDYKGDNNTYKYSVPINSPIHFESNDVLELDPYILGLMLGDGGFTTSSMTFTNPEEDLLHEIEEYVHSIGCEIMLRHGKEDDCVQYRIVGIDDENEFSQRIDFIGLKGCDSRNKFIPMEYMKSSVRDRELLLSGIINTDGSVSKGCSFCITTYSYKLCNDIAELARSIGLIATINGYDRTNDDSTNKYDTEIEYHVRIIGDFSNLHLSKKHRDKLTDRTYEYVKSIKDITLVGKEESKCIMVDCPTHTYITKDYIVTHNTTIIKEVCEKLAGEDGYMFLECGKEDGADSIDGINYLNCPEWSMDYEEDTNSIGFEDFIDDVVDNKVSEYPYLKTVIIDTYDQLLEIAKPEVIRMHNAENPEKPVKSIKAAFGGYMAGEDKASEIVLDKLWSLKRVGVHFIIIGHVKQKTQEDVVTGQTYTSLTTNMSMRDFNVIKTKLHFLGVASIDREIVQEKTGKKDNKNKDIMKGVITKESRRITFRDDSYSIDSKSRFADIVPEIEFNSDALIAALTDAIKAEAEKGKKSFDDLKIEQEEQQKIREKKIAEAEEAKKKEKELNEINSKIKDFCLVNKSKPALLKPLVELAKKHGYKNPALVDDIDVAKEILALTA